MCLNGVVLGFSEVEDFKNYIFINYPKLGWGNTLTFIDRISKDKDVMQVGIKKWV